MRILSILVIAAVAAGCSSCSMFSKKPSPTVSRKPPEVSATDTSGADTAKAADAFKKEGITIHVNADPQLNRYQKNAHALFLCIYQLKDPNGFNQLVEEGDGISKLMECRRFDSTVANAKQLVVQPGQNLQDIRDKAEGARFIGIATGYYGTGKEKLSHLAPLPAGKGSGSSDTVISIELGPYEITDVKVK
jgi:type VI secretion system VasD/TssJ family lipoprotein